jgi:perosamine synthetase
MLPVSRPSIGTEELKSISEVFDTGWLGHGAFVIKFENRLKEFLGSRNVIAVNTGTSALHLALDAIGINKGDEVIVPSLTFCAGIQAITALGAKPIFCEVSPRTLNVDVEDVKKRITPRTRAIMPVHFCGNSCDMNALLDMGRRHSLTIVEDAAHAFGSSYQGRKLGSFGDMTCFSFDPIKNITCGEGGAIALDDDKIADFIRRKRLLGMDSNSWNRHNNSQGWHYQVTTQGYRYHMSNINAAIGLAQIEKFDMFIQKKRNTVQRYNDAFRRIKEIETMEFNQEESCPFAYMGRVVDGRRDQLMSYLKDRGIGCGIHYIPNHLHPYFQTGISLPVTEKLSQEIITLPLYYDLQEQDISHVITSVQSFFVK